MKPNTLKPRQLRKQNVWYYLPQKGESDIYVYQQTEKYSAVIRLPARKLLKELQAVLK